MVGWVTLALRGAMEPQEVQMGQAEAAEAAEAAPAALDPADLFIFEDG